ncbi:MAG: helix-turn-helix transcriptional regulator [Christensenellaceae bacterium]|jgi:transcriptional regulator with XRE-family HTH domain|nr:helix-turn-helix transcriptional regulator [Christensenellaceae bacterium]
MKARYNFTETIKRIMDRKGLNQFQLAKIIGIRQSQVHNWIIGKSLPGYTSLKLLMKHLDLTAEELLGSTIFVG